LGTGVDVRYAISGDARLAFKVLAGGLHEAVLGRTQMRQ
jgi:hypothetical protein